MKNYGKIAPLILILFFALGVYALYSGNMEREQSYLKEIASARAYGGDGVVVDSVAAYERALAIEDNLPLRIEAGQMLRDNEEYRDAVSWGEQAAEDYPYDKASYEFLLGLHFEAEDYKSYFEELDVMERRGVQSGKVAEMTSAIEYVYFFEGQYKDASVFSGGYAAIAQRNLDSDDDNELVWGHVRENGKRSIARQFSYAGPFYEDLAPVTDQEGEVFYVDPEGNRKLALPEAPDAERLGSLRDGVCPVWNGAEYAYYDTEGSKLSGGYEAVSSYSSGAAFAQTDGVWKLIGKDGGALTDKVYESVAVDEIGIAFRYDRAIAFRDGKCIVVNTAGEELAVTDFEDAKTFADDSLAAVCKDRKWGFIDQSGATVIEPAYQDARSFANGFAAVKQSGRWGFINEKGEMVIEPIFEETKDFSSIETVFVFHEEYWKLLRLYRSNYN